MLSWFGPFSSKSTFMSWPSVSISGSWYSEFFCGIGLTGVSKITTGFDGTLYIGLA